MQRAEVHRGQVKEGERRGSKADAGYGHNGAKGERKGEQKGQHWGLLGNMSGIIPSVEH